MVELIGVLLEDFLAEVGEGFLFGIEVAGASGVVLVKDVSMAIRPGKE